MERLFRIRQMKEKTERAAGKEAAEGIEQAEGNSREVWIQQRKMRTGYTTGSCAAAAAKAAARMLLSGRQVRQVSLLTPKGIRLCLEVEDITSGPDFVSCAVRKDSGDDPDVTDGISVYARVTRLRGEGMAGRVLLDGGEGVGRVARRGLEQEIGEAAINKVPRRMIREAVQEQQRLFSCRDGLSVVISIPGGAALAAKTFNPRLGIEGGLSVLGTSGIVEPMSEKSMTDTMFLEMKVLKENGLSWCCAAPGNYGSNFLTGTLGIDSGLVVKCSNFIGEAIDSAVNLEMKGLLLAGHIGKLAKVAAGVMNTHSRQADCRMEVLAAHAAVAGAGQDIARRLMGCLTTEEALGLLKENGLLKQVMASVTERVEFHLRRRAGGRLQIGAVLFSAEQGLLGKTSQADALLGRLSKRSPEGV